MEESRKPLENFFNNFFKVVAQPRTYANIFYLLLAFPLGIFYLVFFITGLSLGVGLAVIFIGIPIIIFMFYISKHFMAFERTMARSLLGTDIPDSRLEEVPSKGFWARFRAQVFDLKAWKSMVYLLIKFPLGTLTFTLAVTLISICLALVSAPVTYGAVLQGTGVDIFQYDPFYYLAPGYFTSSEKSIVYMVIGILLYVVFLHVLNFMAYISGKFTAMMSEEWK